MTHRIGNKDIAQQRSKQDKKDIKKSNIAREAIKKMEAKAKYRNAVKGQTASWSVDKFRFNRENKNNRGQTTIKYCA